MNFLTTHHDQHLFQPETENYFVALFMLTLVFIQSTLLLRLIKCLIAKNIIGKYISTITNKDINDKQQRISILYICTNQVLITVVLLA